MSGREGAPESSCSSCPPPTRWRQRILGTSRACTCRRSRPAAPRIPASSRQTQGSCTHCSRPSHERARTALGGTVAVNEWNAQESSHHLCERRLRHAREPQPRWWRAGADVAFGRAVGVSRRASGARQRVEKVRGGLAHGRLARADAGLQPRPGEPMRQTIRHHSRCFWRWTARGGRRRATHLRSIRGETSSASRRAACKDDRAWSAGVWADGPPQVAARRRGSTSQRRGQGGQGRGAARVHGADEAPRVRRRKRLLVVGLEHCSARPHADSGNNTRERDVVTAALIASPAGRRIRNGGPYPTHQRLSASDGGNRRSAAARQWRVARQRRAVGCLRRCAASASASSMRRRTLPRSASVAVQASAATARAGITTQRPIAPGDIHTQPRERLTDNGGPYG